MKIAITGTNSGLGLEFKKTFSKDYDVITFDKPLYDLNSTECLEKIDLTGVDVLINNAGHSKGGGVGFIHHNFHDYFSIIDTNFRAPIYLTQKFIQQNPSGKIIFITSRCVEKNIGGDSVYSASKMGLSTFIDCLRDELSPAYKLVEIRPGRIKTNFPHAREIHSEQILEGFYNTRPHMSVDDIVNVVKFSIDSDIFEKITVNKE